MRKSERIYYNFENYAIFIDYENEQLIKRSLIRKDGELFYGSMLDNTLRGCLLSVPEYLRRDLLSHLATHIGLKQFTKHPKIMELL